MKRNPVRNLSSLFGAAFALASLAAAFAHEGHDHAPQPGDAAVGAAGPVELTDSAIANLGVETTEAVIIELRSSVQLVAQVEPLPEKVAQITPRFDGTVTEILAKLGEPVKAGQPLLRLTPRTVGNPEVILKAPFGGVVTKVNVTIGQGFAPESELIVVGDYSSVLARGTAYENPAVLALKIGDPATLTVDVFPGIRFEGTIQRSDVGLESDSKTFEVYALIDNKDGKLRPNLLGELSVGVGKVQQVLAVPERAILGDLGNLFAFVRDGTTFEKRGVMLGIKSGGLVEILEGIFPGEEIVTRGNYQLQFASAAPKKEEPAAVSKEVAAPPTKQGFFNTSLLIGAGVGAVAVLLLALLLPRRKAV